MVVVASNFITLSRAKLEITFTFNFTSKIQVISDKKHISWSPLHLGNSSIFQSHYDMMIWYDDDWLVRGIMANMVLCVIPGQGNSKILNLVKSGSFDSPIFLYIPNDEKPSTGHLIWPQPFIWQPFLEISCPGMTLWI